MQPKNQFSISYRARVDGVGPLDCLALADRIAEALGISATTFTVNFDFAASTFIGPAAEARELFSASFDQVTNTATITIGGATERGNRDVTVSVSVAHSIVTVGLQQPDEGDFTLLVTTVVERLPRYLGSADEELVEVRRLHAACASMAADSSAVAATRAAAEAEANFVTAMGDSARDAEAEIGASKARIATAEAAGTEGSAAIAKLLETAKAAHQDVEDKQVKVTAVANNAADFQRRIEEAEQKARAIVEDVQTKTSTTLADLQAKASAAVAELQTTTTTTLEALRSGSSQTVQEHTDRTTAIVTKNEELHQTIELLLQGANAGELFKAFQARKSELERTQDRWLWALGLVTTLIVGGGGLLVFALASASGGELGLIAIKVTVLLPLVVLDIFIANQYNHRRSLIEEYAFKAAISLSLIPYKNLVRDQAADASALQFVLASVEKIYANPSDAATRSGPATKDVRRAMKTLQDLGIVDLAKSVAEKAKP
ncbi:MAG: hypothetical protein Q8P41_02320 [Pseudomonadota bacterium]|nr:hypothetical protein [Pseudomonadota bacterium]